MGFGRLRDISWNPVTEGLSLKWMWTKHSLTNIHPSGRKAESSWVCGMLQGVLSGQKEMNSTYSRGIGPAL